MSNITPFKIDVSEAKLQRLKQKLALADFPDEVEGVGWDRGSPLADIKRLTEYWREGYDWRKAEKKLNELPQFTADVEVEGFGALNVHFVHQKSEVENAIPLIFVHGWPGSFDEVSKILPELVKGGDDHPAFHVVAPSLLNFGFSQGVTKKGFNAKHQAIACHQLMQALGYKQYVTQGGDFGMFVTRGLGILYPESCKASHLNMMLSNAPSVNKDQDLYFQWRQTPETDADRAGAQRSAWFRKEGYGYNHEQSTKPQTIGYSVADSPVGHLAWVYEKLHDWTDGYPWTDDEILTWISIYWFSRSGPAAAMQLYYEAFHDPEKFALQTMEYNGNVKLGWARFPKELSVNPMIWARTFGPIVYESDNDRGGHFAAWERPDVIVRDLRTMFGKKGGAYASVHDKTGYR